MDKKNRGLFLIPFFLIALTAVLFFSPKTVSASDSQDQHLKVKAAYFSNGDFMHKAADGSYEGYDTEYYYTIAGYAGWDIEFVDFDSLNDATKALEDGTVDIMSGLAKTTERESKFIQSSRKMCTSHISVQVREDDDRFSAGDTDTMTDMTCGILKGSILIQQYKDWCSSSGLTPHIIEYDTLDERNAALKAGEVDAIAGGSTIEGAQKIAEFPALDLYFMLNKSRTEMKAQLDRAMNILQLQDSSFENDLFAKYFPDTKNTSPSFSAEEKDYIKRHHLIRVAFLKDDAPFSETAANGSFTGILPEYLMHLSEKIGTDFSFKAYDTVEEEFAALASGDVDAVGKEENDAYDAEKRGVILTNAYIEVNPVQIARAGTNTIRTAAVSESLQDWVSRALKNNQEDLQLSVYPNGVKCFEALKTGEVDSVICSQPTATWLLNRNRSSDYIVSSFASGTFNITCALPSTADGRMLRSILNKTIRTDTGYIQQLITSDTLADSADFSTFFDKLPVSLIATIGVIAAALLIITVLALVIILRHRKTERKLAAKQNEVAAEMEMNRARREFFGTVSHDMRTPLNGILGFTDLALKSDKPEEVRECLKKIRSSGNVLSGLVNDTLIMSRIENGKYVLHPETNELSDTVQGVLEPIRSIADEKGVALSADISAVQGHWVSADRLSIQKILLNLLSNAVKFTPKGGTVTLKASLEPSNGNENDSVSVFRVSDNGIGVSKEFLPRMFEPFAQENAPGSDISGSGMGLPIVKSIVEAMKGTIDAESTQGKGTTFTVRLPLLSAKAPKKEDAVKNADTEKLKGKKALICEDNSLNMEIIKSILERFGMSVTPCTDGNIGVETFRSSVIGNFDIIFLDLRMPVMGGMQAARAIRGMDRRDAKSVPIFAVSADAYPENVAECLSAGMNGHISKPIDAEQLIRITAEACA